MGVNLRGNIEAGLKLKALDYSAAAEKRLETYNRFNALFERFDVLLTPCSPVKQFPVEQNFPDRINGRALEDYTDWFASNYIVTLVSLPAASAPAGLSKDGLPVGMQIVAPRFEEPLILRVARLIHRGERRRLAADRRNFKMMRNARRGGSGSARRLSRGWRSTTPLQQAIARP